MNDHRKENEQQAVEKVGECVPKRVERTKRRKNDVGQEGWENVECKQLDG